jgi:uncharacterized protein YgiM (DUF1202 family)
MKRYSLMVLMFFIAFTAQAKDMYVVDYFKIMVRRQPGEKYKITAQLPSNEKVELMRIEDAWAEISFRNGKKGWILKRYLTEDIPKPVRIAGLETKVKELAEKIESVERENLALKQKNTEMGEALASQAEKMKIISLENQRLREKPYRIILLASGGGIFLLGCIMALILQRMGRGKKNKLSF